MSVVKLAERDDSYRAEVIDQLEQLLAAAKRGEILSLAYACDRPGGMVTMGSTRIKDRYMLLGYLAHQMYITSQLIHEESTPSNLGAPDAS